MVEILETAPDLSPEYRDETEGINLYKRGCDLG